MSGVLTGFATIWLVTAAGWALGRLGVLGAHAERVLARLVFFALTPALLFTTLARSDPARLVTPALAAFALSAAVMALAGAGVARLRRPRAAPAEAVVAALCASYVNAANLGIPVAAYVLGDVAAVTPVLLFQVLFAAPAALAVLDAGRAGGADLRRLALLPARNPIILASAAGIALALVGVRPAEALLRPVELVGSAAVPVALIALGLALGARTPGRGAGGAARGTVAGVVALKTVGQPVLAYLLGRYALGLTGPALFAAVVTAALPTAQNVFVFASRYERAEPLARDAVAASTLVATVTMAAVAVWLA